MRERQPVRPDRSSHEWRAYPTHREAWALWVWHQNGEVDAEIEHGEMFIVAINCERNEWEHPDLGPFQDTGAQENEASQDDPYYVVRPYGFFVSKQNQTWLPIHDTAEMSHVDHGLFFSEELAQKWVQPSIDWLKEDLARRAKAAKA